MKDLITLVLIFLIVSCSTTKNNLPERKTDYLLCSKKMSTKILSLDTIGTLEIKTLKNKVTLLKIKQIKEQLIREYATSDNYIYIEYYLQTGKFISVDSIKYPKINDRAPLNYLILNKDTIFYLYGGTVINNDWVADSALVLSNSQGVIQKIYNLKGAKISASYNRDYIGSDLSPSIMANKYSNLCIKNNKWFVFYIVPGNLLGEYRQKIVSIAGYVDLKTGQYHQLNVFLPDIKFGQEFLPEVEKDEYQVIFAHNGELLFSFRYTPNILLCNYKTGKVKEIRIKNNIIDTIYRYKEKKQVPNILYPQAFPENWLIVYDKYRHFYYRVTLLPVKKYHGQGIFTVLDTNFNVIGERLMYSPLVIVPMKDKILIGNKFVKLKFSDGTNMEIIDKMKKYENRDKKKISVEKYFRQKGVKIKNDTVMVLWHDGMCHGIAEGMLDFYVKNKKKLEVKNQKLLMITQNPQLIKYIKEQNAKNIFIDSTGQFSDCYNAPSRAMMPVFMFFRNKKLYNDTVFSINSDVDAYKIQYFISYGNYDKMFIPKSNGLQN